VKLPRQEMQNLVSRQAAHTDELPEAPRH
jgi:hypothetical protein